VYLERTNASVETVNRAAEIRTLAERQMGNFLKTMPKATGVRTAGGGEGAGGTMREPPAVPTLAEIGITKKQSATAQKLADIPEPEFRERVALTKASGQRISAAKIIANDFSPQAKAAGEAAERQMDAFLKQMPKASGAKGHVEIFPREARPSRPHTCSPRSRRRRRFASR
jgi:hypothetical protein